jgi:hypothetical protein
VGLGGFIRAVCWAVTACGAVACSSAPDGGPRGDSGTVEAAAEADAPAGDSACWSKGNRGDCQTCCNAMHTEAGIKFFARASSCACATQSLCGTAATEGGTADASSTATEAGAGGLGQGACTQAMCSGQAVPSGDCQQCVTMTLQPATGIGVCAIPAAVACGQDTACAPIVNCASRCP